MGKELSYVPRTGYSATLTLYMCAVSVAGGAEAGKSS